MELWTYSIKKPR